MIFKGYIILFKDKDNNFFYLLENLEISESLSFLSIYESIFEEEKIHKLKENEIEDYVQKLKEKGFNIKIIISIFVLDGKPFIGKFKLI